MPVFALHGSPGSRLDVSAETEGVITELGGRLITYDRPGYGQSDGRGPETRVVDHVDDVRAIADWLGLDGFSITGFSGGAPPALAVAARLPDRVVRVSITGAIAPLDLVGLDEWQRRQDGETREYTATVRASEAACTTLFQRVDAEMRAALADDDPMRDATLEGTRQGVAAWVNDERALEVPWGFEVSEIRAPTVVYANPNDTVTPPNHAGWLAAHIRPAVLVASAECARSCRNRRQAARAAGRLRLADQWRRADHALNRGASSVHVRSIPGPERRRPHPGAGGSRRGASVVVVLRARRPPGAPLACVQT